MNKNSRIFIAGHKGLVGSAVYRNLKLNGYKKILVIPKNKLDLKDQKKVELYFKKNKIEYLIICAALAGGIMANQNYPVQFFNENILIQNSLLNSALKFSSDPQASSIAFANSWLGTDPLFGVSDKK